LKVLASGHADAKATLIRDAASMTRAATLSNRGESRHQLARTVFHGMQHGCTLMSTDGDFARFPKLKWSNPLK
jgi:hypothetical protein